VADSGFKVTDKRMFTLDGELRDEYRFLDEVEADSPPVAEPEEEPSTATPSPTAESEPAKDTEPVVQRQASPPGFSAIGPDVAPRFYDLVAALAEPATVYLGDQPLPGGQTAENLELARFYIDLLDILRQSTGGNLQAQEASFLEDTLYQLRVRYVQKSG